MFTQLKMVVDTLVPFSAKEWRVLEQAFTFRQVPKKYKIVQEGAIAREIYFINKGVLRLYYNNDGNEITGFLFTENLFASCYESFLQQAPSIQILEALEDCELLVLSHSSLQTLYAELPKMHVLTRIVAEQRFINAQKILSSFILDTPEERYHKFALQRPELLQRVPQHIIASFLGITPVSLSRIRKRQRTKE